MNTFAYLKLILNEELLAIKELLFEQRWLVLVLAALVFGLVYYLKPFPPRNIYIAAGDQGSGYWKTAESYAYYFQENGVSLNPVETAGSIENAKLLADNKSDVRVAVIQGGALDSVDADKFYSLGSIAYEPLWIFYRTGIANPPKTLADLTHLRIGTGPTLGGTQKLFHDVMQVTGFTDKVFKEEIQASYQENLKAFNEGKLDVIVKVASYHDPEIQALVKDPDVGLMPIADAAAYQKGLPYLYALNIPTNSIDIAKGIPSHSIPLIGTTTSLIVDKDLHPDIQMLLLVATRDIQRSSQSLFFSKRGEFPAYVDPTVEASPVALHYYDYGVPPGMRYLPFWLAGFINRMWVLILSVIAFTYPLAKLNLQLREIRYHIKHRRLYEELLGTELFLCEKTPSVSELGRISDRLKHLNREAINVRVPVGSEAEYFDLLQAIELLRAKVRERVETT
mgnify:CR=1 FL=1